MCIYILCIYIYIMYIYIMYIYIYYVYIYIYYHWELSGVINSSFSRSTLQYIYVYISIMSMFSICSTMFPWYIYISLTRCFPYFWVNSPGHSGRLEETAQREASFRHVRQLSVAQILGTPCVENAWEMELWMGNSWENQGKNTRNERMNGKIMGTYRKIHYKWEVLAGS